MLKDSGSIVKRLERDGWERVGVRGSHPVFRHPVAGTIIVVPHPKKDLPVGTVRNIYRAAGWSTA